MEQTKNKWALKVVLTAVFAFAMTLALAFGIIPGTTLTAHAETYHDQYVDRSTIQDGDVFCADQNNIHIFNDMHTVIQVGEQEEVVDWNVTIKSTSDNGEPVTEKITVKWDEEIVVPFGKVYTYQAPSVFVVTNVPGEFFISGSCIARLNNGVLTVGSKTGFDASMDDHGSGNRAGWCIQPFNSMITKVVVLDKVTWIGDYAFYNLPNLKTVEIASSVKAIGNYAFSGSGLETFTIPDTVTSLGSHMFDGCFAIKSVTFPESCKSIGDYMFANCGSITSLAFLDGIETIGSGAFSGCGGLQTLTSIPDSVVSVGSRAFSGCAGFVDVTMPNNITSIGTFLFANCSNLEKVRLSNGITNIPDGIVNGCNKLTEVIIGSGVTHIDHTAFYGSPFTKATFVAPSEPHDLSIELNRGDGYGAAFDPSVKIYFEYDEFSDPDINLYRRVKRINEEQSGVLYEDYSTFPITLSWRNKYAVLSYYSGDCVGNLAESGTLTVKPRTDGGEGNDGSGKMADASGDNPVTGWVDLPITSIVIEDGVTSIGSYAFCNCSQATSISIGKDVERIGAYAFNGCSSLKEIPMPDKVKKIEGGAFLYCVALESAVIPAGQTSVEDKTFQNCYSLKSVTLPDSLKSIGMYAFSRCRALETTMIPKTVTNFGQWAFEGCSSIKIMLERPDEDSALSVYPYESTGPVYYTGTGSARLFNSESGAEVQDGNYLGNPGRNYVWRVRHDYESGDCIVSVLGPTVTVSKKPDGDGTGKMADYASCDDTPWNFRRGEYTHIVVEEGVTSIGDRAFSELSLLKGVSLPAGLKTIGIEAFKIESNFIFSSVTIPSTVTEIKDRAFVNKYFQNAYFECPGLEAELSTVKIGVDTFPAGAFVFVGNSPMRLCEYRTMVEGRRNNTTLVWRRYQYEMRIQSDELQTELSVDEGKTTIYAGEGEQVNITVSADSTALSQTTLSAYIRDEVTGIQDIVDFLGDAVFKSNTNLVCKVVDGKVAIVKDGNVILELTDDYSFSYMDDSAAPGVSSNTSTRAIFTSEGVQYSWLFEFDNDILEHISVVQHKPETALIFELYRVHYGILKVADIPITDSGDGHFSFTMPAGNVKVIVKQSAPNYISAMVENGTATITENGEEIQRAGANEIVTLRIDPMDNCAVGEVGVFTVKELSSLEEIKAMMGDAVFQGTFGTSMPGQVPPDFTQLICKINENGHIVVMNGSEIVYELAAGAVTFNLDAHLGKQYTPNGPVDAVIISLNAQVVAGDYTWIFYFSDVTGYLNHMVVKNGENTVFEGDGRGIGGTVFEAVEPLTVVTEGKEYTFVMPDKVVIVSARCFYIREIDIEAENGKVVVSVDGDTEKVIKPGDTVTLNIEPDSGYTLKDIAVYNYDIVSIDQLVALMGDAVFTGTNSFSSYTCKVNENGNFVIMNGDDIVFELTDVDRIIVNQFPSGSTIYAESSVALMSFTIQNGVITRIASMKVNNMESLFDGQGTGNGKLTGVALPLNVITEGKVYTFTMPDADVKIVAMFEERNVPEHDHDETTLELVAAKDATCETAGNIAYYRCTVCGELFSDANGQNVITAESTVIPALDHDYRFDSFVWDGFTAKAKYVCSHDNSHIELYDATVTNEVTTAATCEGKGVRTYTATYDGHTATKTEEIESLGHEFTTFDSFVWDGFTAKAKYVCSHDETHFMLYDATVTSEVTTAATCTETGVTTYTATYDGHTETKIETTKALGHDWGEWIVITEPTNDEEGLERRVCSHDETHVEERAIPVHSHNETTLELVAAKAATCTETGNIAYYVCKECGKYFADVNGQKLLTAESVVTPALGHDYQAVVTAPTCTERGYTTHTCSRYGDSYVDAYVDALGHDYQDVVTVPTCTERGFTTHTCSRCGDSYVDTYVDALGHKFGEWVVTKEAQIGVKGEETRYCSLCGETETREIAALPYVPATNDDGEKVYSETLTEEAKDVTELFAQAKEEEGTVEVKANDLVIVFDSNAVNAIGNSNVSLSAQVSTENLTVENAELVIEVTLTGATFANGSATVSVPFAQEVPTGKVAKVYYIADDGTRTDMNATFENGKVSFVTNHFSTYAVVFEEVQEEKKGCSGSIDTGFVFGALLIACAVLFVLNKKGVIKLGKKD